MAKKQKKPWETKRVMDQVYDMKLWGGKEYDFFSGTGSHDSKITDPYIEALKAFFKTKEPLIVCDLGCGDFNIGKHLVTSVKKYIAIDIVEKLIDRNKKIFQESNLEFDCLDISKDKLPLADCLIIRQVLQHLSNAEILKITKKIETYKYVILTEHLPMENFIPNKDIISGQGIRLKQNSGVNLLEAPFNLKIKNVTELDDYITDNKKGHIVTTVYQLF